MTTANNVKDFGEIENEKINSECIRMWVFLWISSKILWALEKDVTIKIVKLVNFDKKKFWYRNIQSTVSKYSIQSMKTSNLISARLPLGKFLKWSIFNLYLYISNKILKKMFFLSFLLLSERVIGAHIF